MKNYISCKSCSLVAVNATLLCSRTNAYRRKLQSCTSYIEIKNTIIIIILYIITIIQTEMPKKCNHCNFAPNPLVSLNSKVAKGATMSATIATKLIKSL